MTEETLREVTKIEKERNFLCDMLDTLTHSQNYNLGIICSSAVSSCYNNDYTKPLLDKHKSALIQDIRDRIDVLTERVKEL